MKVIYFIFALTCYLELCHCTPLPFKTKSTEGILLRHGEISSNLQKLLWNSDKSKTLPSHSRVLEDAPPLPEETGGQWFNAEEDVDSSSSLTNQNDQNPQTAIESKIILNESELPIPEENTDIRDDTQMLQGMFVKHFNNGIFKVRVEPEQFEPSQIDTAKEAIATELPVPVVNSLVYYNSFETKPVVQEPILLELPNEVAVVETISQSDDSISNTSNNETISDVTTVASDEFKEVNSSVSVSNSYTVEDKPETSTASHATSTVEYVKIQFPGEPQKEISISQYPGKVTENVELSQSEQEPNNPHEDFKNDESEIFNQELDGQLENSEPSGDLEAEGSEDVKATQEYENAVEEVAEISNAKNELEVTNPDEVVTEGVMEEALERSDTESESDIENENEIGVEDEITFEGVSDGVGELDVDNVENENQTDFMEDIAEQLNNDETESSKHLVEEEILRDEVGTTTATTDGEAEEATEGTMSIIEPESVELIKSETIIETSENNEENHKEPFENESIPQVPIYKPTHFDSGSSDPSKLVSDVRDIISGNFVQKDAEAKTDGLDRTTSKIIDQMWKGRNSGESVYFKDAVRILLEKLREEVENSKPFLFEDSKGLSYSFEGLDLYELKNIDILNIKSRNRKIIEAEFTIGPFLVAPSEESSSFKPQYQKIDGTMEIRIRKQDEDLYTVYLQRLDLKKPVTTNPEIEEDVEQYISSTELTNNFVSSNFKNLLEEKIREILRREDFYYLFSSFYRI